MFTFHRGLILTLHSDCGHAWLAVPLSLLRKFGVAEKISSDSYQSGSMAYLDEDVDAFIFADAAEAAGVWIRVVRKYEEPTPIRGYPTYRYTAPRPTFRLRAVLPFLAKRIPLIRRPRHEA